jgi:hypothetical protein
MSQPTLPKSTHLTRDPGLASGQSQDKFKSYTMDNF